MLEMIGNIGFVILMCVLVIVVMTVWLSPLGFLLGPIIAICIGGYFNLGQGLSQTQTFGLYFLLILLSLIPPLMSDHD